MKCRPDIVLILADDTTPNILGCYGGGRLTPNIDALAARGIRFTSAFCASAVCTPSRYNYLTGNFVSRCRDPLFLRQNPEGEPASIEFNAFLNPESPSLPSLLRRAGYATGFAGKWHTSHPYRELELPDLPAGADPANPAVDALVREIHSSLVDRVKSDGGFDYAGGVVWENTHEHPLRALHSHFHEWSLDAALEFLDQVPDGHPLFLHFASTNYHGPNMEEVPSVDPRFTPGGLVEPQEHGWRPRREWADRIRALGLPVNHETLSYLTLDDQVGAISAKLEQLGRLSNTIFVFGADHNNEPGKSTCFDTGSRIPLLMAGPGIPASRISDALVQNLDVAPTLLTLAGASQASSAMDGCDLSPIFRGEKSEVRDFLFFENGYTRAVRSRDWKLISLRFPSGEIEAMRNGRHAIAPTHYGRKYGFPALRIAIDFHPAALDPDQLYHLGEDPLEQRNLFNARSDNPRLMLHEALHKHLEQFPHPFPRNAGFLEGPDYRCLAAATRKIGCSDVGWVGEAMDRFRRLWPNAGNGALGLP